MRRIPLLFILLATPAAADIPTIDATVLDVRGDRSDETAAIDRVDRDRYTNSQGVTCALYRPARKGDPAGAARANPTITELVRRVAREERVDGNEFLALVYQESRFNPCARSSAGAIGLAQLMPATAAELGADPYNVEQNLRAGARYFKQQLSRFNGNFSLALAAYNSGAGNVENYGGIPPFRETQEYVRNITQKWLPAFGGADNSDVPQNYGATSTAYEGMRSSTVNAMALSMATGDGLGDVASWLAQLGTTPTGSLQDSWDHNSGARTANIAMLNRMIALGATLADLANTRNAVRLSDISGANRSGRYRDDVDTSQPVKGPCDAQVGLVWDVGARACVARPDPNAQLLLDPQ